MSNKNEPYGVIYTWTNNINQKIYVGQTVDPQRRQRNYLEEIAKDSGRLIINAMKKYGHENFTFQIIDKAEDKESLDILEKLYIEHFRSHVSLGGYNLTIGGYGNSGFVRSESDKQSKREAAIRRWNSPKGIQERKDRSEMFKGANNPRYGKVGTMTGIIMGEESRAKMRAIRAGKTSRALRWEITHPNGTKEVITNLTAYCRNHQLAQSSMISVSQGLQDSHKGYLCKKLNP